MDAIMASLERDLETELRTVRAQLGSSGSGLTAGGPYEFLTRRSGLSGCSWISWALSWIILIAYLYCVVKVPATLTRAGVPVTYDQVQHLTKDLFRNVTRTYLSNTTITLREQNVTLDVALAPVGTFFSKTSKETAREVFEGVNAINKLLDAWRANDSLFDIFFASSSTEPVEVFEMARVMYSSVTFGALFKALCSMIDFLLFLAASTTRVGSFTYSTLRRMTREPSPRPKRD